jgi:heat shock protein HslJ
MKHLLLLILTICSINCIAQEPNPNLFQTWYLYSVQISDNSKNYIVSEINPAITPYLTILENLNFSGKGACNTFGGTFNLFNTNLVNTTLFSNTTDDCCSEIQNDFESSYFDSMKMANYYWINTEEKGMSLFIGTPPFGSIVFKNFKLNTLNLDLNPIEVYTNPTTSMIHIISQNTVISKIELFNSNGQNIKTINDNFETINSTDLSSGIYILKIYTEFGTLNKKILIE